ncbi:hypothetical protein DSO57_1033089 [Entomophthora muscae]|uniref:Uncharacterized protein n=1 Tax=Entomophthora muscae TaxID=34485 RepID=A0ACC2REY1_9FUNG|nr:hypothetical protein DSO57_1033089 [Entomophthora muscae]
MSQALKQVTHQGGAASVHVIVFGNPSYLPNLASASDEEPTKKRFQAQKTPPKDKSPTHKEHYNKPPSSPKPPNSPHFSLSGDDSKPYPDYFPSFWYDHVGPWDLLLSQNI